MSRGLGRVELRILELLGGIDQLRAAEIACEIAGRATPTPALAASVRRAIASLQKKGRLVRVRGRAWMLAEKWQYSEMRHEREEEVKRQREAQERSEADEPADRVRGDAWADATMEFTFHDEVDYRTAGRRLAKVLGLLGSAHEGEVLNAARQAEQIRLRLHLSWEEMIMVPDRAKLSGDTKAATVTPGYGPNFTF